MNHGSLLAKVQPCEDARGTGHITMMMLSHRSDSQHRVRLMRI